MFWVTTHILEAAVVFYAVRLFYKRYYRLKCRECLKERIRLLEAEIVSKSSR